MKCPHCAYKHGWLWVGDEFVEQRGGRGPFWECKSNMVRSDAGEEETMLFACPCCSKTFIGEQI